MPTELPLRVRASNCSEGRHEWGREHGGFEYAGSYRGGKRYCEVPGCNAWQSAAGGKLYEPPYWQVTYTTEYEGRYAPENRDERFDPRSS